MRTAKLLKKWTPAPVKQSLLWLLERSGFKLTSVTPLDMRLLTNDPFEAFYRAGPQRVLLDIPLEHCRCLGPMSIPGHAVDTHPFAQTLAAYDHGECTSYDTSPLRQFYQVWQPRNVAEALGLDPQTANARLVNTPALGLVMPWWDIDPVQRARTMIAAVREENRCHGAALDGNHGLIFFGPASDAKGQLEIRRLVNLFDSIRKEGYKFGQPCEDGDIRGCVLSRGSSWKVQILRGEHRVAALAALHYDAVPIRFDNKLVVRREEVDSWPNVRAGLFTREQALAMFDRMFEGRPPILCNWPSAVQSDGNAGPAARDSAMSDAGTAASVVDSP